MTFRSYAQNFEDVMLWRALKDVKNGFYLDIGANHPEEDSVSFAFYQRGWRGIHVEPIPEMAELLRSERPDETVIEAAISQTPGQLKLFDFEIRGIATGIKKYANHHEEVGLLSEEISVASKTLSSILDDIQDRDIHWMKIDVEGMEGDVIASWGNAHLRPWVLVIESVLPNQPVESEVEWEQELTNRGYSFVYFDGLNRFYVHEDHTELADVFSSGPNIFDEFIPNSLAISEREREMLSEKQVCLEKDIQNLEEAFKHANRHIEHITKEFSNEINIKDKALIKSIENIEQFQNERKRLLKTIKKQAKALGKEKEKTKEQCDLVSVEQNKVIEAQLQSEKMSSEIIVLKSQNEERQSTIHRLELELQQEKMDGRVALEKSKIDHRIEVERETMKARQSSQELAEARALEESLRQHILNIESSTSWRASSFIRKTKRVMLRGREFFKNLSRRPRTSLIAETPRTSIEAPLPANISHQEQLNSGIAAEMVLPKPCLTSFSPLYFYVDHSISCPVNTGMQRVVRGLAAGLIENGEKLIFVKWSRDLKSLVRISRVELKHLGLWNGPVAADENTYSSSEQEALPISSKTAYGGHLFVPEVTHINSYNDDPALDVILCAKQLGLKTTFIFYDAIPLRRVEFSEIAPKHERYMRALMLADYVTAISEWSARDLVSYFLNHESADFTNIPRVEALMLPGTSLNNELKADETANVENVILCVGTIELRKNQLTLIEAFQALCDKYPDLDWRLEFVGNLHPGVEKQVKAALKKNSKIINHGNVSDEVLTELYHRCTFTVFPSVEEGFGLPILESLSFGKPCICADFGSMREVAQGGGCLTTDVRVAENLSSKLEELINNPELQQELEILAKARPETSWRQYADSLVNKVASSTNEVKNIGRIYYWVDHTCIYPRNTGIQRVVRSLARALISIGVEVYPVKWDMDKSDFTTVSIEELEHLEKWNGPKVEDWAVFDGFDELHPNDWLLLPELISGSTRASIKDIHSQARLRALRLAWVFYDAIPWKLKQFYPQEATDAHGAYMRALNDADIVLSISKYSNDDLFNFLSQQLDHTPNLRERLRPVLLPAEFSEADRITTSKLDNNGPIQILSVGTVEPRKNHLTLLEAFQRSRDELAGRRQIKLCIAGGAPIPDLEAQVRQIIDNDPDIVWEQNASDSDILDLYLQCDFTVYPSVEEGFGLPILESLWNARPCICADQSSMKEIAAGGGCLNVDPMSVHAMGNAIQSLAMDDNLRLELVNQAIQRKFKTWDEYAIKVVKEMIGERHLPQTMSNRDIITKDAFEREFVTLKKRPLLSICISTFNRADWLDVSLKNLTNLLPIENEDIELVVCDNTSTDHTPEVVKPYLDRSDFSYHRNLENVGMLGNLRVTAHSARGEYIWILGDDDLVLPGAIENVLTALKSNTDAALVYLNYSYSREDDAANVTDLDNFFESATLVAPETENLVAPISVLSTQSENFFTAIYCLVYRRDHALKAYSQDTSGRPFSTMLTCIPTTYHVLHKMMHETGVWLGGAQLVVNLNVSWMKYATLWILERLPEAFDTAEKMGAKKELVDKKRIEHLPHIRDWFLAILKEDGEGNREYFDPLKLFSRFKHLAEFRVLMPELIEAYRVATIDNPTDFSVEVLELMEKINE